MNHRLPPLLVSICAAAAFPLAAHGQAAVPAATAPARYVVTVPPGYEKHTAAGHTAICLPRDAAWVKKALAEVKPATRPSTMPADLLQRATAARPAVVKQMVADLGLGDDKAANAFFDDKLIPTLRKLDEVRPPVFFLVCTRDELRELAKTGWGEPRFHYNRVSNDVRYNDNVMVSIDRPMDDSVLPAFFDEKHAPDERSRNLAAGIQQLHTSLAKLVADQSPPNVFNMLAQHLGETYFEPLKLRRDQQWFALGAVGNLAAKYAGQLTHVPREAWLKDITFDPPQFPVTARTIDLARPMEEAALRPAAVPLYHQAMRRKSIRAVARWGEKAGDGAVAKVVAALRTAPPADGAALVKLVQAAAPEFDVAKELAPQ
jgi:hypothetical protein